MLKNADHARHIVELADRIADDIDKKKLRPGDPYLSTADVARLLRVNGTKANRALQLLAQRRVLERRQRKGTFVAQPPTELSKPALRRVHLLVHQNYLKTEGLLADGVVLGLQGALPHSTFQFNFLPSGDGEAFINRLVGEALRAADPEGFVLVRSTVQTQRIVQASGLPAVVYGSRHASITGLAQVERDQRQIGVVAARYLAEKKCRRVAVLLRDQVREGDHRLLDALQSELTSAGFQLHDLTLRCLPADYEAVKASVREQLSSSPAPLGIICRSEPLALAAAAAADELQLPVRRRPQIVACDVYRKDAGGARFPYVKSVWSPEQVGREIGLLLLEQTRGERMVPACRLVPVTLQHAAAERRATRNHASRLHAKEV